MALPEIDYNYRKGRLNTTSHLFYPMYSFSPLNKTMSRGVILKILYLVGFVAFYFFIRWPLYSTNLANEDGNFADLLINQTVGPKYLQGGRVNGVEIYAPAQHPALSYEILKLAGRVAKGFVDFSQLSDYRTTLVLRFVFSLFQLSVWLGFILVVFLSDRFFTRAAYAALLAAVFVVSVAPLAVLTSIELQVDTSIGVLFTGFFGAVLLARSFDLLKGKPFLALLFVSSLGMGLGKNEWSAIFLFCILLAGGFRFAFPRLFRRMKLSWRSNEGWLLVLAAGGCLVGNLISYLVDPLNYMMGWKLLLNISRTASVVGSAGIRQWLSVTYHRLPEMIGVAALLGLIFVLFVRRLKTLSTVQILSFSLSICLFGAFFFSSWGVFVRYFVPSFISAVASLIILFPRQITAWQTRAAALAWVIFAAYAWVGFPHLPPYQPFKIEARSDCVPFLPVSLAYNRPDLDYVGSSVGQEEAESFVKGSGKSLCPR